jgi:hypothetical protein
MVSFNAKTVKLLDDKDGLGADIQILDLLLTYDIG